MIKCPNCSAELKYEIESESVVCSFCGSKFNPEELNVQANKSEEISIDNDDGSEKIIDEKKSYEAKRFSCSQCGAELLTFDDTAVTFCSYCGSQAMIESRLIKLNNPDYIIPFKKTKEECINNYKKKLRRNFFTPGYMKSDIVVNKFRGIFMPYVVYKLSIHGNCSNTGEKYSRRSGDYVYYDIFAVVSNIDSEYEGLSYDLASNYYDKFSNAIPFNINEKKDFNINYLSGYYADKRDVGLSVYDQFAKNIARKDASYKLYKEKKIRKYSFDKLVVPLEVEERKTAMFPVYFLSVKDKDGKHINYAVVNGQTGEVAADVPIDFKKYLILSLLIAIVIYLLINEYLLILPRTMLIFSVVVSAVSWIISNKQLNKLQINKEKKDDLGVVSKDKENNSLLFLKDISFEAPRKSAGKGVLMKLLITYLAFFCFILFAGFASFSQLIIPSFALLLFFSIPILLFSFISKKISNSKKENDSYVFYKKMSFREKVNKYLFKQIVAFFIGLLVLALDPVDDLYYYGGCIITLTMVVLSFYDLVKERNEIISNELPQLGKRGGDENE